MLWSSEGAERSAFAEGSKAEEAVLRKCGFTAGLAEQPITPGNANRDGLSIVVEASSAASARAAIEADATESGPWQKFAVSGIPGAIGFEQSASAGRKGARDIGFTVGRFAHLEGVGWQSGRTNAVSTATLRAAALKVYGRVRSG